MSPLYLLLAFLCQFAAAVDDDAKSSLSNYIRFDPTKRIPTLTESNWSEWSWKFQSTVAALTGITTSILFWRQSPADLRPAAPADNTDAVKRAKAALTAANQQKNLANTDEQKEEADEAHRLAVEALAVARQEAADAAAEAVAGEKHPFEQMTVSQRTACFQLIVRTISPALDFLVMSHSPATLLDCWNDIRGYFVSNTRGVRNQLKVAFYTMVLEPAQKLAEFKHRIDHAARTLNSMSPDPSVELISEDDKTTVLMSGVRKHHARVFATTLDILEQSAADTSFEDTYKRMLPAARRAETAESGLPQEEKGLSSVAGSGSRSNGRRMSNKPSSRPGPGLVRNTGSNREHLKNGSSLKQLCRDFSKGKCARGKDCRFAHRTACTFCGGDSHSVDRCWKKKRADKVSKSGAAFCAEGSSDSDDAFDTGFLAHVAGSTESHVSMLWGLLLLFIVFVCGFLLAAGDTMAWWLYSELVLLSALDDLPAFLLLAAWRVMIVSLFLVLSTLFVRLISSGSMDCGWIAQHRRPAGGVTASGSSGSSRKVSRQKLRISRPSRARGFSRKVGSGLCRAPSCSRNRSVDRRTGRLHKWCSPACRHSIRRARTLSGRKFTPRGVFLTRPRRSNKRRFLDGRTKRAAVPASHYDFAFSAPTDWRFWSSQECAKWVVRFYLLFAALCLAACVWSGRLPLAGHGTITPLGAAVVLLTLSGFLFAFRDESRNLQNAAFGADADAASDSRAAIDSGSTQHLFRSLAGFLPETVRPCKVPITVAGGKTIYATHTGVRRFKVQLPDGSIGSVDLLDALYVPRLRHNLISVRKFDELGLSVSVSRGLLTVSDAAQRVFMCADLRRGLYRVRTPPRSSPPAAAAANVASSAGLPVADAWHRRLAHAALPYLQRVLGARQMKGVLSFCDACVRAKMTRVPFRSKARRRAANAAVKVAKAMEPLSLVVSDLCGPFRIQSLSGKLYFATLVDVGSRFVFVLFLRHKNEFHSQFADWLALIKAQTGKIPTHFHADGGTEFLNKEMCATFSKNGVHFTTTAPGSPNQNAIAERVNRTLLESARAMMFQAGAAPRFWAEAVRYAAYVRNRLPHRALQMDVPALVFPGVAFIDRDKLYNYTRVWGCCAWMHRPGTGKTDPKAVRCVFLGIDSIKKAYRLYRLDTGSVSLSRDVVFDESRYPFLEKHPSSQGWGPGSGFQGAIDPADFAGPSGAAAPAAPAASAPDHVSQQVSRGAHAAEPSRRVLRANPEPSAQAIRNIAGDSADLAAADESDELPFLLSDSDDESDDSSTGEVTSYFSRFRRAHRFARRKKKSADPDEPSTRKRMLKTTAVSKWLEAEVAELQSIKDHGTWEEVPASQVSDAGRKPLTCRWVYKIKRNPDHTIERYKARLTVRGFAQIYGLDYVDVFAAVAQLKSFRILMALSAIHGLRVTSVDISNAFLNGELKEVIYMEHPEGYPGTPGTLLRLRKALYGLKQSPRVFGERLQAVLADAGFVPNKADGCVLYHPKWVCFICIFVDDLSIHTSNETARAAVLSTLTAVFRVRDLGPIKRYLGIEVEVSEDFIFLHQRSYVESMVNRYGMTDCKPTPTPATSPAVNKQQCPTTDEEKLAVAELPYRALVGSLWYAANGTRPDVVYATNVVSQYGVNHGLPHWRAAKRVLRYLRGTVGRGIKYLRDSAVKVIAYADSDWAGDIDTRRSRTGFVVTIAGGAVVWQSKAQKSVALSSCEAELYALCECVKELLWLTQFLAAMGIKFDVPILWVDNQGAIALAENPVNHQRSKHIDIRWFFVRDVIDQGLIEIRYIQSEDNLADINTKPVVTDVFLRLCAQLMTDYSTV